MIRLSVVCDCRECSGEPLTKQQFLDRKRWSGNVVVSGRRHQWGIFAVADSTKGRHQVAIEKGSTVGAICKHGLAALRLVGNQNRLMYERDQAERMADSLARRGVPVKTYDVNGCVTLVSW